MPSMMKLVSVLFPAEVQRSQLVEQSSLIVGYVTSRMYSSLGGRALFRTATSDSSSGGGGSSSSGGGGSSSGGSSSSGDGGGGGASEGGGGRQSDAMPTEAEAAPSAAPVLCFACLVARAVQAAAFLLSLCLFALLDLIVGWPFFAYHGASWALGALQGTCIVCQAYVGAPL
jgi:hypothetical protein